jgi:hypothetical protein
MVLAVVRLEHTPVQTACARLDSSVGSFEAGLTIAQRLRRPDLRAMLVFSEGLHVNGSELIRGLNSELPANVVVTGGLAGDGDRFQRTWVIADGVVSEPAVCAAGLYGEHIRVGHGSEGGWDRFGLDRLVTRSRANVLYELDGKPALALYKEYLGHRAADLPASGLLFPLSLGGRGTDDEQVVRTILAVDESDQSIKFAGDIPEGSFVTFMHANADRLVQGAHGAASMIKTLGVKDSPVLSIPISCVGRRLVLGERTEEESEAVLEVLPDSTQQIGFYSYGEISPHRCGRCDLHNQTMTVTAIAEG